MPKEYTEIQLKAKDEKIPSWWTKSDDTLSEELAAKWSQVPEDEVDEEVIEEVIKEAPKTAPAPASKVTFFWKDNRNAEFSIVVREATKDLPRQNAFYATEGSVLVLDPSNPVDAEAIKKLRAGPRYQKEYAEVDHRTPTASERGAKLDELMELDHDLLAKMVGGTVQDYRKTTGDLIAELMG